MSERDKYIFDLCGTLVSENTTKGFSRFLMQEKGRGQGVLLLDLMAKYFSFLPFDMNRKFWLSRFLGETKRDLYRLAVLYARDTLKDKANPKVLSQLYNAKDNGAEIWLMSASVDPVVAGFVEILGLDGGVSSRMQYSESEVCTGRLQQDLSGSKQYHIPKHINKFIFFSDNEEDCLVGRMALTYFKVVDGEPFESK